mgnify:CR=1 FL=1
MRIIYLGGSYWPLLKVRVELQNIQNWFNENNAAMLVDCKFDQYEYIIRRQQLADRLRSKWKLIQGSKASTQADK